MDAKLSEVLWKKNQKIASSCLLTNFVIGLEQGNLPLEYFQSYIAQDSFFLEAFVKAYAIAISKSNDRNTMTVLSELLIGVIQELNLHDGYARSWDVSLEKNQIHASTKAYINFLISNAKEGQLVEIIASMTPCLRLYYWIGKTLSSEREIGGRKYDKWILTYSHTDFEKLVVSLEDLLNQLSDSNNNYHLYKIYETAMKLELGFFQAFSP
tara:strand:+ start:114 stop:746 length:633 start_codon:yes stop_codon:yes gene_type:complete